MNQRVEHLVRPVARSLTRRSRTSLVGRGLSHWAAHSQQRACRNAMVASTALQADRLARAEAQAFVETLIAHRSGSLRPDALSEPDAPRALGLG